MDRKNFEGDNINDEIIPCQMTGLSCFGCCGFDFVSKEDIEEALDKNTLEFSDFISKEDKTLIDLKGFKERTPAGTLRVSGICYNLIWLDKEKGIISCPLHPKVSEYDGEDLRTGHCNPAYLCKTAFIFRRWAKKDQQKYIDFIKKKNLDSLEYSIKTDDGSLLKEFEENI